MSEDAKTAVIQWLSSDRTGTSSKDLCSFMFGRKDGFFSTPWDCGDFGRCYQYLSCHSDIMAEFKKIDLHEMGGRWIEIQKNFQELERIYLDLCKLCGYKIGVDDSYSQETVDIKTKRKEFREIIDKCNAIEDKKDNAIHIKI